MTTRSIFCQIPNLTQWSRPLSPDLKMPREETVAQNYCRQKRAGKAAFSPLRSTRGRKALQSLQQFRERCFEGRGDFAEGA